MILNNVSLKSEKLMTLTIFTKKHGHLTLEENFRGKNAMMWVPRDTCGAAWGKWV